MDGVVMHAKIARKGRAIVQERVNFWGKSGEEKCGHRDGRGFNATCIKSLNLKSIAHKIEGVRRWRQKHQWLGTVEVPSHW